MRRFDANFWVICAYAGPILAQIADDSPSFSSLDEASRQVLTPLRDIRARREQAGVLMQDPDGKYFYTTPAEQAREGFSLRIRLHAGWKIAGIYHTHPGTDRESQLFSLEDLDMARQLGVPSYIMFQSTGDIRKFVPGQTATALVPYKNGMIKTTQGDRVPAVAAAYAAKLIDPPALR